jgi:hypothetical protein
MTKDSGSLAVFRNELLKYRSPCESLIATFYNYNALETEETAVLHGAFRLQKKDSQARSGTRRQGVTPGTGLYLRASHLRSQSTLGNLPWCVLHSPSTEVTSSGRNTRSED